MAVPAATVLSITSADAFDAFLLKAAASLHVVFFYADFHAPSLPGGQLDGVVCKLAELHPGVRFGKVRPPIHTPGRPLRLAAAAAAAAAASQSATLPSRSRRWTRKRSRTSRTSSTCPSCRRLSS